MRPFCKRGRKFITCIFVNETDIEDFYHAIGMPNSIPELIGKDITEAEIEEMVAKCSHGYI